MTLILDTRLPPRTGWARVAPRGQRLRIIEVDGGQIGDFVVFNADNLRERFDQGRTKANQGRLWITTEGASKGEARPIGCPLPDLPQEGLRRRSRRSNT